MAKVVDAEFPLPETLAKSLYAICVVPAASRTSTRYLASTQLLSVNETVTVFPLVLTI